MASTAGDNGFGSFELTGGTWTYTLDQSAVQDLDAGDVVNDTITFTATDGSTQVVTVAITGHGRCVGDQRHGHGCGDGRQTSVMRR